MTIATAHRRRTRIAHAFIAALLGATTTLSTVSPAQADVIDLLCPIGEIVVVYTPGLTLVSRPTTVTVTIAVGPCTSSDPTVHSGVATASGSGNLSCLAGGGSGTDQFTWDNGQTSTVDFTDIIAVRPLGETVGVFYGEVTAGKFAGDFFIGQTDALALDPLECLSPTGVTSNAGPFTFLLTSAL